MLIPKNRRYILNRRKGAVVGKGAKTPRTAESRYDRILRQDLDKFLILQSKALEDAYRAGVPLSELSAMADRMQGGIAAQLVMQAQNSTIPTWFNVVDAWSAEKFQYSVRQAMGIDAMSILDNATLDHIRRKVFDENVYLISTIPREHLSDVMSAIVADFRGTGFPDDSKSLSGRIQQIGHITRDRARVIARDQTAKLNSALAQARQEDAGVTHYIWRTAEDIRVVGTPGGRYPKGNSWHGNHFLLNGKIFAWNNPQEDGHPGEAIQCRCVALPVFNREKIAAASAMHTVPVSVEGFKIPPLPLAV